VTRFTGTGSRVPESLRRENTRRVRFRLGGRRLLLRDPVEPRLARALGARTSLADERSRLPSARLGRLTEAVEPIRASREMCVQQKNWKQAAIRAGNLSALELTLGQVAGAVVDAEQS